MNNVLFIAYHFPPIGGAATQRAMKFVRYLPEDNYFPIVVTGPGESHDEWTPDDRSLLGEIGEKVAVYRVSGSIPHLGSKHASRIKRWLALRPAFYEWWIGAAIAVGEEACRDERPKLIFASMSPFASADVAAYLSRKFRIPWVADLRDAWALDEIQVYPSFFHRKLEMRKMHDLLATASLIVMNTPEAKASLLKNFTDFGRKNVVSITNGFDPQDFEETVPPRTDNKFRIIHSGSLFTELGLASRRKKYLYAALGGSDVGVDMATRSPLILFKAIERWFGKNPEIIDEAEIVFVGNTSTVERAITEKSIVKRMCHFTGYLARSESIRVVRTADLLFLPMHNILNGKRSTSVPSKTYEYMASGRPILAAVPEGDAKDFLIQSGSAFICSPDDVAGMISILSRVYDHWKKKELIIRPNETFLRRFERKNLTKMLAQEFSSILQPDNN